jgi:hypothetical protein
MIVQRRTMSRAVGACCVLTSVISACASPGNGTSNSQPEATTGVQTVSSATADSVPTTDQDSDAQYVGPLDEFLGLGNGREPTEADLAEQNRQEREVEEALASCMQALGFQYEPAVRPREGQDAIRALSEAQFAAQYGYGITTIDRATIDGGWVNPNEAIVDAMTVPQRAAYFNALYGDMFSFDENGFPIKTKEGRNEQPPPTSCAGQADNSVFGTAAAADDATTQDSFSALQASIRALYAAVDEDPRLSAPRSAWTDCMATAGYSGYTDLGAGRDEVTRRSDALNGDSTASKQADPAALSELRAFEIAVATADYQCSRALNVAFQVVEAEVEQAFIDDNRAQLEQFRDALAAGTAHVDKG